VSRNFDFSRFAPESEIAVVLELSKNNKKKGNTHFLKKLKKRGTPLFPKLVFSGFEKRGVRVLNKTNEDGCFIFFLKSSRWVFRFLSEIFKMSVSFSF